MEMGIAAALAFITAIPLTYWYMKDKILIHSGPGSQANAWFGVFTTAMIISFCFWMLIVYIFSGIFSFIRQHIDDIAIIVALFLVGWYFDKKKKEEDIKNDAEDLEKEDKLTNIPYTVKDENGKTEMQRLNIEKDALEDELKVKKQLSSTEKGKIKSRISEIKDRQKEIREARHRYEERVEEVAKKYNIDK